MKLNVYSIYDTVACVFNKPFTDVNNATAERTFREASKEQVHIKDYELYNVGAFNDGTGEIIPNKHPIKVISGLQVVLNEDDA